MNHPIAGIPSRVRSSIEQWLESRKQECIHCHGCGSEIAPFDSHCPKCGQGNPAKVSTSAGVYLAAGIAILTLMLSFLARAF